jgi:actin-like ATPase involved in cell morphogenesis
LKEPHHDPRAPLAILPFTGGSPRASQVSLCGWAYDVGSRTLSSARPAVGIKSPNRKQDLEDVRFPAKMNELMAQSEKEDTASGARAWSVEFAVTDWVELQQLSSSNIVQRGLLVCGRHAPPLGVRVEIVVALPDSTVFETSGRVTEVIDPAEAPKLGRVPGFVLRVAQWQAGQLALLEVTATSEVQEGKPAGSGGDELLMPGTLRGPGAEPSSVFVRGWDAPAHDVAGETTLGSEPLASPDDAVGEAFAADLAPPKVDLAVLDEAPAPPPADLELVQSGLYDRPELTESDGTPTRAPPDRGGPPAQPRPSSSPAVEPPAAASHEAQSPPGGSPPSSRESASAAAQARLPLPVSLTPAPPPDHHVAADGVGQVVPAPPSSPQPLQPIISRPPEQQSPLVFGIDFGTSFTSIAVVRGERVVPLEDAEGSTLTPSVVCFPEEGEPLVGWPAREKALVHPTTTFRSPKRLLGRRYDDKRIEPFIGSSPLRTQAGPNGQVVADVYGEMLAIPQICAHIFEHVKRVGQRAAGVPVKNVLLSAPVGFDRERLAIKRAAELAGLHVVGVIDEPVAAAMAYGLVRAREGLVAVYDFGGGTFDFTVLEIKDGKSTVVGEAGDDWLGGDDFDHAIAEQAANMFWRKHNVDLRKRAVEWERLLMYCERAKRKLSVDKEFELCVPGIVLSVRGGIDLKMRLDREIFTDLCGGLVEQTLEVVGSCLELLGLEPTEINQLVLTGGVTRIPMVRKRVQEYFRQKARMAVNPEHAIVLGNAIYGHVVRMRGRKRAQV